MYCDFKKQKDVDITCNCKVSLRLHKCLLNIELRYLLVARLQIHGFYKIYSTKHCVIYVPVAALVHLNEKFANLAESGGGISSFPSRFNRLHDTVIAYTSCSMRKEGRKPTETGMCLEDVSLCHDEIASSIAALRTFVRTTHKLLTFHLDG